MARNCVGLSRQARAVAVVQEGVCDQTPAARHVRRSRAAARSGDGRQSRRVFRAGGGTVAHARGTLGAGAHGGIRPDRIGRAVRTGRAAVEPPATAEIAVGATAGTSTIPYGITPLWCVRRSRGSCCNAALQRGVAAPRCSTRQEPRTGRRPRRPSAKVGMAAFPPVLVAGAIPRRAALRFSNAASRTSARLTNRSRRSARRGGGCYNAARVATPLAGWQSGYAADCNSVYAGSIPTPASTKASAGLPSCRRARYLLRPRCRRVRVTAAPP